MADWYFTDKNGYRCGPISGKQLKALAMEGVITPDTIIETEEGKTAPARRVKGLTFAKAVQPQTPSSPPLPPVAPNPFTAAAPPANQTVSQSVPVPVTEGTGKLPWVIASVGIAAVLIVGVIGWAAISVFSPVKNSIKPPAELNPVGAAEQATIDRFLKEYATMENMPFFPAEIITQQIDALIVARNAEIDEFNAKYPKDPDPHFQLSPSEKQAVVVYLALLQKTRNEKYDQSELNTILRNLESEKRYLLDLESYKIYTSPPPTRIDVYTVNKQHILCIESSRRANSTIQAAEKASQDWATATVTEKDAAWAEYMRQRSRAASVHVEYDLKLKLAESTLPESNRLSGNAHDAEEQSRLNVIQRERDTRQRATEARELFQ